jgi:hypothetical protein
LGQEHFSNEDWSNGKVIDELKAFEAEHGYSPSAAIDRVRRGRLKLSTSTLKHGQCIISAAQRHYGSLHNARMAAKLPTTHEKWSVEKVQREYLSFYKTYRETPNAYTSKYKHRRPAYDTETYRRAARICSAIRLVNTSAEEIHRKLDLTPIAESKPWTRSRLKSELRAFMDEHNATLRKVSGSSSYSEEARRWANLLRYGMKRCFGTRSEAKVRKKLGL